MAQAVNIFWGLFKNSKFQFVTTRFRIVQQKRLLIPWALKA